MAREIFLEQYEKSNIRILRQRTTVTYKSTNFYKKPSYLYNFFLLYMLGWAVIDIQFLQL